MVKLKSLKNAKRIPDPVFKNNIYLFQSKKALIAAYKEMNLEIEDLSWVVGCQPQIEHSEDGKIPRMTFIAVFNKKVSTLAHEVNHAVFEILSNAGVRIENPEYGNNETFCYLSEYLLEECLKHLKSE